MEYECARLASMVMTVMLTEAIRVDAIIHVMAAAVHIPMTVLSARLTLISINSGSVSASLAIPDTVANAAISLLNPALYHATSADQVQIFARHELTTLCGM